ncbi:helix-turn-helix transcriptional regulator [Microbispora sp. GKU 823]|uniref:helix-turn-helix transcriptional regulator n=1 Tax=Microbispora sp. GKU 823 TaxID=1652100 RepID=UPI0009A29CD8|nr:helix-turn-helix transcriptional regulator [Microbispora sp. GKU 823]OPG13667.1 hypothetical protein B1L11_06680 [Microbispora sp. GKU 823]
MSLLTKPRTLAGITGTRPMRRVLLALLTDATNLSGLILSQLAGISPARVYICLDQLELEGWITGTWQNAPYPRRRFYQLTPAGWSNAYELLGLDRSEARRG